MLDLLLTLPGWVMSLVGAAILGAVGVALSLRLKSPRPGIARALPLAFFILGYGLTDSFVVPWVLVSEPRLCAEARAVAHEADARQGGNSAGALTVIEGVTADCAARTIATAHTVAAARTDVDPGSIGGAESAFIADTCGDPQLRRLIAAGWRIESRYRFTSGPPYVMVAAC
ncbi:MAG TPA: hypothetical protein GYA10_08040 [Alphaproteobacteria bacterium]|nr:hypothetical protein [Alphaproteobacteria bacterium]